jgi:hypothetical protein
LFDSDLYVSYSNSIPILYTFSIYLQGLPTRWGNVTTTKFFKVLCRENARFERELGDRYGAV